MSQPDPSDALNASTVESQPGSETIGSPPRPRPSAGSRGTASRWLLLLAVGTIAGLASWAAGEAALQYFAPKFMMSRELASSIQTSTREVARQKRVYTIQTA